MEVNKIYNENCLDTMARMPDCFVDLTVTSPPYDNLRTYNGYSFDFEAVAKELYRVTKQGGVVVWVVGDATIKGSETGTSFRQALYFKEIGFNLHDTMIYGKNGSLPLNSNRYEPIFEYMFVFSKGKPKSLNKLMEPCKNAGKITTGTFRGIDGGMKHKTGLGRPIKDTKVKGNIWFYDVGNYKTTKDAIAMRHPAIFPEQLAKDHIISWSNPGDLVFDPFLGSGTTAKVAILNQRNWIGSEISKEYCEIAEKRINENL
jgi:site-specific DNA-methyltransferase (adenine-specific)